MGISLFLKLNQWFPTEGSRKTFAGPQSILYVNGLINYFLLEFVHTFVIFRFKYVFYCVARYCSM